MPHLPFEPLELGGFSATGGRRGGFPGVSPAIDLRQLRFAVSAAEHGSFRRAAQALNVEPSAFSRRIADLEYHLGVRLFDRQPIGVRLTREGRCFLGDARRALDHIGRLGRFADADAREERDTLRIGILPASVSSALLDAARTALRRFPQLRFVVTEGSAREHRAALANQSLDVAFLPERFDCTGLECRTVAMERLVLVCPAEHRLAAQAEVNWRDLRDERLLVSMVEPGPHIAMHAKHRLAGRHGNPVFAFQPVGLQSLLHLVALGQGVAVMAEFVMAQTTSDVVYRPIEQEVWPLSVIWSARNPKRALRRLLGLLEDEMLAGGPAARTTAGLGSP